MKNVHLSSMKLNEEHRSLCKFSSHTEDGYCKLLQVINMQQ